MTRIFTRTPARAPSLAEGVAPTKPRLSRLPLRLAPALAVAAGVGASAALGFWQLGRAHEKEAAAAQLERAARAPAIELTAAELAPEAVEWRRVTARGRFEPRYAVFLDNRVRRGVAGYHVLMPLALEGGARYVLVNRGWIARAPGARLAPEVRTPEGAVEITGLAVVPRARFLELSARVAEGAVWQNFTLERYRQAVALALQPFVIRQESALEDGLARDWEPPDLGVNTHYSYALQWFSGAAAILILALLAHVRRRTA